MLLDTRGVSVHAEGRRRSGGDVIAESHERTGTSGTVTDEWLEYLEVLSRSPRIPPYASWIPPCYWSLDQVSHNPRSLLMRPVLERHTHKSVNIFRPCSFEGLQEFIQRVSRWSLCGDADRIRGNLKAIRVNQAGI